MKGEDTDEVIRKIREVEIQGATSVAREGIRLLRRMEEAGRSRDEVEDVAERLREARPTEPLLFNSLDMALGGRESYDAILGHIDESRDEIVSNGRGILKDSEVVYTHCHSSTVTRVLRQTYRDTDFEVRATETRPLYQGRETARELSNSRIPTSLYVDSGARLALEGVGEDPADVMLIGADAVGSRGNVINKIGSRVFANVADSLDVPVYVLADSWKYLPDVEEEVEKRLERRDPDEVWEEAPDGVDVVNYAFELVPNDVLEGIVTEIGIIEPGEFGERVESEYPKLA
ncbi:translation initiation factor eIF-2B [Halorutilales archaeon Cl-col2-1]